MTTYILEGESRTTDIVEKNESEMITLCKMQNGMLPPAMYNGSSDIETYSHVSTYTSGSYYDEMKERVKNCLDSILEKRIQEGCNVISIADFGTADGVNFLQLLKDIIDIVDKKSPSSFEMTVYLNDLPGNDFNQMFSKVNEHELVLEDKKNIFFVACARSMYKKCVPTGCLDLAVSSIATHWLSKIPCTIKDGLACVHGSYEERKMFREQAKLDWKNFLLSRGTELKSGGYMVVVVNIAETENMGRSFFACLSDAWRQMHKECKITNDEFQETTLGLYTERTEFDLRSAFEDPEIRNTKLKLVSIRNSIHHLKPLLKLHEQSDKLAYASALVDLIRPWVRNVLYEGLSEKRPPEEKELIVKEYFQILVTMAQEEKLKILYLLNKEVIAKKL